MCICIHTRSAAGGVSAVGGRAAGDGHAGVGHARTRFGHVRQLVLNTYRRVQTTILGTTCTCVNLKFSAGGVSTVGGGAAGDGHAGVGHARAGDGAASDAGAISGLYYIHMNIYVYQYIHIYIYKYAYIEIYMGRLGMGTPGLVMLEQPPAM